MAMRLMILNGPELQSPRRARAAYLRLLANARPRSWKAAKTSPQAPPCGLAQLAFHQVHDHDGVLVDLIQSAARTRIAVNPAAGYSFTSIAIFDAIKIFEGLWCSSVHISNIHARDELHLGHARWPPVAVNAKTGKKVWERAIRN